MSSVIWTWQMWWFTHMGYRLTQFVTTSFIVLLFNMILCNCACEPTLMYWVETLFPSVLSFIYSSEWYVVYSCAGYLHCVWYMVGTTCHHHLCCLIDEAFCLIWMDVIGSITIFTIYVWMFSLVVILHVYNFPLCLEMHM